MTTSSLSRAIQGLTHPAAVMGRVTEAAMRAVPAADGSVIEMADGEQLVYSATSGSLTPFAGVRLALRGSLSGLSVLTGRTLRCDDALTDPRVDGDACRRVGAISLLCVPLRREGRAVGVLKIIADRPHAFTGRDEARLGGLADFVAAIVATAWEMHQLTTRLGGTGANEFIAEVLQPGVLSDHSTRRRVEEVLASGAIDVVLQPIVDLGTGRACSAEALARFPSPPLQGPDVWFADAHRVGLGLELELAAARRALELLPRLPVERLAINVGPDALASDGLAELLDGADASRVTLELTEHLSVSDYTSLSRALAPLRERGVHLAIDDTGAGFASLAHVVRLRPDVIKLDRGLIDGIEHDPGRRAIGAALARFAAEAGAEVVAEGIEEEAQLRTLRELGIRHGQGYLLGRPAPLPALAGSVAA